MHGIRCSVSHRRTASRRRASIRQIHSSSTDRYSRSIITLANAFSIAKLTVSPVAPVLSMKKLFFCAILCTFASSVFALPTYDYFNYTVGQNLADQINPDGFTWLSLNGSNSAAVPAKIADSGAAFSGASAIVPTGFPLPGNNAVFLTGNYTSGGPNGSGGDLLFGNPVTNGQVYASFFLNVTDATSVGSSGAFWACFTSETASNAVAGNNESGRILMKGSAPTYQLGLTKTSGTGSQWIFESGSHNQGDVLFCVLGYDFSVGKSNFMVSLWINPNLTDFGAVTPPAFTVATNQNTASGSGDISAVRGFALLNRNTATGTRLPNAMFVDDVHIGRTWAYVTGGPEITTNPVASASLAIGSNIVLNVAASVIANAPSPVYQWKLNGNNLTDNANIIGSSTPSLTITNANSTTSGSFACVIANTIGTVTSSNCVVTVPDPVITQQPPATTNAPPGSSAIISITANGSPTLTYQWKKNSVNLSDVGNISGSATPSLTLSSISSADNGTYACVVKNGLNATVTSSNCVFSVTDPAITTQPQSAKVNYGTTQTFSIAATGTGPFSYSWQRNGANISDGTSVSGATVSGSTTTNLSIAGVAYADNGTYTAVVNGANGTTTSLAATLVVVDPIIVNQPTNTFAAPGTTVMFHVDAAGTPTLGYKWRRGTTTLTDVGQFSGTTTSTLTIANVVDTNMASYNVIVSGISGTNVTSSNATLTVNTPAGLVPPPMNRAQHAGENSSMSAGVVGLPPVTIVWSRNGTVLPAETNNTIVFTNITAANNGTYTIQVSNAFGTNSASATLTVSPNYMQFFPTNIAVSRLGDGAQPLNVVDGNTITIDQFTTDGAYVSTVMIPDNTTVDPHALVCGGQDTSSGAVGLGEAVLGSSPNNHFLGVGGYNISRPTGFTNNISGLTVAVAPRAAGVVNGLGYYQMTWRNNTSYPGGSIRSVVPDNTGSSFYTVGGSSGLRLVSGTVNTLIDNVAISANNRAVAYFNGHLYISSAATGTSGNPQGLYDYDSPPTAPTTPAIVFNTNTVTSITWNQGQNEFSVSPDGNTIYFANGDFNKSTGNGVERWDNTGTWGRTYTFSTANIGARGLYVDWSGFSGGVGAAIYATTAQTNNNYLVKVIDNGSSSPITILAQAGTNQVFRSIRAAPLADPATIATPPQDQRAVLGVKAEFTVAAGGTAPFNYQWFRNGVALSDGPSGTGSTISGSASDSLVISGVANGDVASYKVVVANAIGGATSSSATLAVVDPGNYQRLAPVWSQAPGSQTYLPADTDPQGRSPLYRSLAYNALSNQLIIVSRPSTTPSVVVLNASTGASLYNLTTTGITGGTIVLNSVACGDDGVVYACDVSTAGAASPDFKLYRWASTDPTIAPDVVYSAPVDPGLAIARRWGDTLRASGVEPNTQIMLDAATADSSGTTVVGTVFTAAGTPPWGFQPFSTVWTSSASDSIGRTLDFAPQFGSTAYIQKRKGTPLRIASNDGSSSTSIADYNNFAPSIDQVAFLNSNLMAAIDFSGAENAAATPDYVDLIDVSNLNQPAIIGQYPFPVNHQPNGDFNGCIVATSNTVYALDSNNGLVALTLTSAPTSLPALTANISGNNVTISWNDVPAAVGATLQYSTLLQSGSWTNDTGTVNTSNGHKSVTENLNVKRFYRLIK